MATRAPKPHDNLNTKDMQILAQVLAAPQLKGRLPCAAAFKMAGKLNITPGMIGDKANELKIRIVNCQLGCFAVEKATRPGLADLEIAPALAEGLQAAMINQQLPCRAAFEAAGKLKVSRKQLGDAATKLNIRLIDCQLGCF